MRQSPRVAAEKKPTKKRRPRSVGIEGTWIAVPIDGGRFVPAMTARVNRSILLLYLFAEVFPSVPRLDEVVGLTPSRAARIHQAGDVGLLEQTWIVIGAQPDWDRTQWPVPPAIRRDPLSKCAWKVQYADDLPTTSKRESRTTLTCHRTACTATALSKL